ncbi:hypothetical protein F4779DRAFT_116939 [Xylariaceae sp. FL0662B]|nr:hypothetical protein F4779DRAFT_116939 [Xylariaceae sp. FL0662B]
MEEPESITTTPGDTSTTVPPSSADHCTNAATELSQSDNINRSSNSVPSLRFPRPLGNRQLTNWISSSSPDIMQPGTIPDDDPTLAELGYDIIGTDGESQAESTVSSIDYQRPDEVQSLAGTDTGTDLDTNEADTDSSYVEEEEEVLDAIRHADTPAVRSSSIAVEDDTEAEDEDADIETLANQSLENPTDFSQHGISSPHRMSYAEQVQAQELLAGMRDFSAPTQDARPGEENNAKPSLSPGQASPTNSKANHGLPREVYRVVFNYVQEKRNILIVLSGFAFIYSVAMVGKSFMLSSPAPRVLSTVPVASVSSAAVPSTIDPTPSSSLSTSTWTSTGTYALQTDSSLSSNVFMPFGRERTQPSAVSLSPQQTICSAVLYGRNEILVEIPQSIKSTWLAQDAILIAISRGPHDIPTKMSFMKEGFLIEIPPSEAHGVLAVSIATTRKPKINETFQVNFGRYKLAGALDAGKQLIKGFTQKVVDTVNETTAWVEEAYIPTLNGLSKQVCDQTTSISSSLLQVFRDATDAMLGFPARFTSQVTTQVKESLDSDHLVQRQRQAQLELIRQAEDLRDELALSYLAAQISSKLWWLRIQGKTEEHRRYRLKAEVCLKEKHDDADMARLERSERVKKHIRYLRKQERDETRGCFWNKGTGGS